MQRFTVKNFINFLDFKLLGGYILMHVKKVTEDVNVLTTKWHCGFLNPRNYTNKDKINSRRSYGGRIPQNAHVR